MSRHGYGQGNGPGWAKRQRANRRNAELVRTTDDRDVGNRQLVERVFGLDGPVWSVEGCEVRPVVGFRLSAHAFLSRKEAA